MNKSGNKRGEKDNNKQNFANLTDEEKKSIPKNSGGSSVSHAVQGALTTGRNKVITPEIQKEIRDRLLKPTAKGSNYIRDYIDKFFATALKDPNSNSGRVLNNILFKEDLLEVLDKSLMKSQTDDVAFQLYKIRNTLYDKQQEVFDNSIDKRILIINSRRSGKTELMGREITKNLLDCPDAHVVYINRNSSAAIRQIKGPFENAFKEQSMITITNGSIESQEVHFSNGAQLLIIGNNNSADIDKLRGERISLCIMDECGHQRNTRQLIREVIGPALKDYGDKAQLILVGTPPRIPHTYVEDCWTNPAWKKYHWTFEDNPFIPNRDKVIEEVCQENGCTAESAFVQREYFGRMDAYDNDSLVIKNFSYITQQQLNQLGSTVDYAYVLVDWGWEDKPAVVSAIVKDKRMYIIDCWSENHNGIKVISEEIKRQYNKLKDDYDSVHSVKVIADNNEKGAVWDLYDVYKIPNVFTAYKTEKSLALEQLNDLFASNKITVLDKLKDSAVTEDLKSTVWIRDEETDKVIHSDIDDALYHPNALMAILYGSRDYCYEVLKYVDLNKAARNIVLDVKGES